MPAKKGVNALTIGIKRAKSTALCPWDVKNDSVRVIRSDKIMGDLPWRYGRPAHRPNGLLIESPKTVADNVISSIKPRASKPNAANMPALKTSESAGKIENKIKPFQIMLPRRIQDMPVSQVRAQAVGFGHDKLTNQPNGVWHQTYAQF